MFRVVCLAVFLISVRGEKRIAGGQPADISQYPFATALLTNGGSGNDFQQTCGGSILTANAILSAASCFHTGGTIDNVAWWRARVGSSTSTSGGTIHLINRFTIHPDFNLTTFVHDLAVVRPTVRLVLSPLVQPASFAGAAYQLVDRQFIWAIGWGASSGTGGNSEHLQQVEFFVVDQSICVNRYLELNLTITDDMVCAGWADVGVTAQCEGDRGSPLLVNGAVVGVLSRAEACPDPWFPAVNTRIAPYSRWIVSTAIAQ